MSVAQTGQVLSSSEAASILEQLYNGEDYTIPLKGPFLNKRPAPNQSPIENGFKLVDEEYWLRFRSIAEAGFVTIVGDSPATSNASQRTFNLVITDKGREANRMKWADPPLFTIRLGTFTVSRIVKNEPFKKAADDLRVVMALYSGTWNPHFQAIVTARRKLEGKAPYVASSKRKSAHVLKWDPFKSQWLIVASDYADEGSEFESNNVQQYLSGP
jgi:hypothetical protein